MDKPLPNRAYLDFMCGKQIGKSCVYQKRGKKKHCEYYLALGCTSAVARVNACVLYLKASGISKKELHRMVEAINDEATVSTAKKGNAKQGAL